MHINKLKLHNFRGADRLELELHPTLNLFVGLNGAGKSTILDASAILLSWVANRIKNPKVSGRQIVENDIRNGESATALGAELLYYNHSIKWEVVKARQGMHSGDKRTSLEEVSQLANQLREKITFEEGYTNLPLFVYYPVNRAVLDIPLRIRDKHKFDLLAAYDESLTRGANFRLFFEWFREREDLENEARRDREELFRKGQEVQFPDPQLEAVRLALLHFMPEFSRLTVRRNPLRMEVLKGDKRLLVNQLSDGEKCLMAMVGDMARRMAIANPKTRNPLAGEALFIIDEIDLHLHPEWQRMVVPRLLEIFPNSQFLISTHSPHVITHIQPESLFLLEMNREGVLRCRKAAESYGKSVERILVDLMGLSTTRPDTIQKSINKMFRLIDRGALEDAKLEISRLREEIGSDPELVKADVLIKRKELIGK
ncbi:MAG: AAA family ATPase [Lentisphaerae bacterium]|mgnify:FL=1|nr:AAA family ATPase [Lentisphaerota bacterium]